MKRAPRRLRLVPIVLFATASLLALKTAAMLAAAGPHGAYAQVAAAAPEASERSGARAAASVGQEPQPATETKRSWAQEMFGFPEVTGSIGGGKPAPQSRTEPAKPADQPDKPPAAAGKPGAETNPFVLDADRPALSAGERAVLERLQERRQELEARGRELEIREGLLKAAEKRIETRIGELRELESQIKGALQKKDEAEAARFKSLVTMYESMKAKEAARIFDRLEPRVLIEVASQINPRRMSDILAQMSPEAAERLTVELASRAQGSGKSTSTADLPKIEGKPRL